MSCVVEAEYTSAWPLQMLLCCCVYASLELLGLYACENNLFTDHLACSIARM
jgi:hypothetical protein